MSQEIWCTFEEGQDLYALVWRKTDKKVYDAVAGSNTFDTYTDADIDDYDVVVPNEADSDYYGVDFPAGIAAGIYRVQIFWQVGGAIDADADEGLFQGEIEWDGTAEVTASAIVVDLSGIETKIDTVDGNVDLVLVAQTRVHNVVDEREDGDGGQVLLSTGVLTTGRADC